MEWILNWIESKREVILEIISKKFKGKLGDCYEINSIVLGILKRKFSEQARDFKLIQGKVVLDRPIIDEGIETIEPYHVYIRFKENIIDFADNVFNAEILEYIDESTLAGSSNPDIEGLIRECMRKLGD